MTTNARPERVGTGVVRNVPGRHNEGNAVATLATATRLQRGHRLAVIDEHGAVVEVLPAAPADAPVAHRTPTAQVVEIKPYRHTRQLRVSCPLCDRQHLPGLGWDDDAAVQYRVAHCGGGDYRIPIPAWAATLIRPGDAAAGQR